MKKIIVANLVLLVVAIVPASAAIRLVPLDYATIQWVIDASADGDTVVVRRGRYCENIDFLGKDITVISMDPDDPEVVENTVIDANGVGSIVTFANGEGTDAVLTGFNITGGYGTLDTSMGPDVYWGGGIYCRNSSPTIRGNVIRDNHIPVGEDGGFGGGGGGYATTGGAEGEEQVEFGLGGGIGCSEASPIITHNIIKDNVAFAGGGIILFMGSETVANNLIYGNSAGAAGGGGVYLGS